MLDGEQYFTCACGTMDHTLRFVLDLDENSEVRVPTIYVDIRLVHYLPWYRRLWLGIKYIFGTDISDSHDGWMIHNKCEDVDRMIGMLQQLKGAIDQTRQPCTPTIV